MSSSASIYSRFRRRRAGLRSVEGKISCAATGGCSCAAPARLATFMNRSWLRSGAAGVPCVPGWIRS
jgi:hypothetical protein